MYVLIGALITLVMLLAVWHVYLSEMQNKRIQRKTDAQRYGKPVNTKWWDR